MAKSSSSETSGSSGEDFLTKPTHPQPTRQTSETSGSSGEDFLTKPTHPQPTRQTSETSGSSGEDFLLKPTRSASSRSTSPSPPPRHSKRKQPKPKRRNHVIREIKKLQKSTNLLIPKLPFQRVVREVLMDFKPDGRITGEALAALHESSEMFVTNFLQDSYILARHAKRITLQVNDANLAKFLKYQFIPPT